MAPSSLSHYRIDHMAASTAASLFLLVAITGAAQCNVRSKSEWNWPDPCKSIPIQGHICVYVRSQAWQILKDQRTFLFARSTIVHAFCAGTSKGTQSRCRHPGWRTKATDRRSI
eukprot:1141633-Pelagomonas_calceolata.AAC.5